MEQLCAAQYELCGQFPDAFACRIRVQDVHGCRVWCSYMEAYMVWDMDMHIAGQARTAWDMHITGRDCRTGPMHITGDGEAAFSAHSRNMPS